MDRRKEAYLKVQKKALHLDMQREFMSRGESLMVNSVVIEYEVERRFQWLKRLVMGD